MNKNKSNVINSGIMVFVGVYTNESNELSAVLKLVVSEYKKGSISLDDVRELARCGMRER
jgi:hypothetical protein